MSKDSNLIYWIKPYKPAKGEEYMGEAQLAHFRNILEAWRASLVDEGAQYRDSYARWFE